jgi:hypothetical protein
VSGTVAGIDVGLSGALAFLDSERPASVETVDMPVHVLTRGGDRERSASIGARATR